MFSENLPLAYAPDMSGSNSDDGLDLAGLGKIAEAIPDEVYNRSAETLLTTFEKLVAPITETTHGFGRYIRQKFDTMVEVEKALATFALEKSVSIARAQVSSRGTKLLVPIHPKSFVRCLEEASRETNSTLHDMWTHLLASQMCENDIHPHFIEILSQFSPTEARLLPQLLPRTDIGNHEGGLFFGEEHYNYWLFKEDDHNPKEWNMSCRLLKDFGLAHTALAKNRETDSTTILYRTEKGGVFLKAVGPNHTEQSSVRHQF